MVYFNLIIGSWMYKIQIKYFNINKILLPSQLQKCQVAFSCKHKLMIERKTLYIKLYVIFN